MQKRKGSAGHYAVLLMLFVAACIYQTIWSSSTIRLERSYELYVPFLIQPFTDRVSYAGHTGFWDADAPRGTAGRFGLRSGDRVLAVNERPFLGLSDYMRSIWEAQRDGPQPRPFGFTFHFSNGQVRHAEFASPHCTCGIPTLFEAATLWVFPQAFCMLTGFGVAMLRPRSLLAWGFLVIGLSLSQIQFWQDVYTEFPLVTTPALWPDGLREFGAFYQGFIQSIWPAGILLSAAGLCRQRTITRLLAISVAAVFFTFAVLQGVLAVAWSENFRPFAPAYEYLTRYSSELTLLAFAAAAIASLTLNRVLGLAVSAMTLLAAWRFYFVPEPVSEYFWNNYSDTKKVVVLTVPEAPITPQLIKMLTVVIIVGVTAVLYRKHLTRLEPISLILCLPLAIDFALRFGEYIYPLDMPYHWNWEYASWAVLIPAALGYFGITLSVFRLCGLPESRKPAPSLEEAGV